MAANSTSKELGDTYELIILAAETSFLLQAIGSMPVRIIAVDDGGAVPADDATGYFQIESARGASDSVARTGLEGADIYARAGVDGKTSTIIYCPS